MVLRHRLAVKIGLIGRFTLLPVACNFDEPGVLRVSVQETGNERLHLHHLVAQMRALTCQERF